MAALRALIRALPLKTWLIIGAVILLALGGAYCRHQGVAAERAKQAERALKTERRASAGREAAAIQRADDTQTITIRQQERDHAAHAMPDSPPDDRERLRRCRQLRDAGRDIPACR